MIQSPQKKHEEKKTVDTLLEEEEEENTSNLGVCAECKKIARELEMLEI